MFLTLALDFSGASAPIDAHLATVLFSLLAAVFASFVAFDLAGRVRTSMDAVSARLWVVAGAVVLGTGIWSMHFIGMAAAEFSFRPQVNGGTTVFSWALAIGAAVLPVALASSRTERLARWAWPGAFLTSLGVATMHLVGMSALETVPGPTVHLGLLVAAAAFATLCCRLALGTLKRSHERRGMQAFAHALAAAVLLGIGLTGLHYMAMAAASYPAGTICGAVKGLEIDSLGGAIGFVTLAFLALMSLVSWLERRSHRLAHRLNRSLNQAQVDLQFVTFNDALTGLPNRLVFQDRLLQAVKMHERTGDKVAVLLAEIDDFSEQTRHLDAAQADFLVREAAGRLLEATGQSCAVTYAGNQQFLLLATGPNVDADAAVSVVDRITDALHAPCGQGDGALQLRVFVGITMFPDDGSADRLTANAGAALEGVRRNGSSRFAFFQPGMDDEAHQRAYWLAALRLAVVRKELALHYQPKVDAKSGLIAGVEALLRWRHPERGPVSPAVFIPIAERFGLINELGAWVMDEACRQMAEWRRHGIHMRTAINVSALQLEQPHFCSLVTGTLSRHGVEPSLLTCELTESGAMRDVARTRQLFDELRQCGVQLSIDDFGTGYSSLSVLRELPIRQLKIDRSFVSDIDRNADARAVIASIVQLAKALRLEVVAEGVETPAQRDILLELGCDKFQGFLFARPMSAADLTALLTDAAPAKFRQSLFLATL